MNQTPIPGKFLKLFEVFKQIDDFWRGDFFIEGTYPWNADNLCCVLNCDEEDRPQYEEILEQEHSMRYFDEMVTVVMIVDFAEQQVENVTLEQLVDSFNYWWRNDAQLILSGK